ncbi:ABC transporter ATP-binding protein [Rodentibacter caecimuris]|uniref:ABC transporter ATP-binding protein n=1 Tax=Rodentibacter caecimuris TaxID=1796644 RepID=A0AAJ3K4S3_9PAST|nr:ABC transporter ATP-binding protein [Rodentibacter heylii]MCX2961319.1 ABC transporter ATP-binding protein [Rodentibacter heylii]OOF71445.1 ABC transporter ATP-binding protein [Rodentibacter heylii]OOF76195.1 ABC transporter ATP-binding protein [Rodentibacter heylii]OOF77116.1 ABC transporter ATP-binding protein [Rodentibacter heylii]QIA77156.1 ABC transporter ATP-binding protein [Rodentibacter heylii]
MIQITNVNHQYPNSPISALRDVNLHILQGSSIGLLGPNGAGKTTLMSLMAGLQEVQSGQILFDDVPFERLTKKQRHQISLVPQDFAFYPLLTVWENLIFFAALYAISDKNWLLELLEKTGLTTHKSKLAKHLSGGLKRRLNFAIGLINRPKVIFLDEITVGIDPQSRQFILNSVADLTDQGVTVIYTSHYLQEIEQLCSQLVLLNEGKVIYQGNLQEIIGNQPLEKFYLDFLDKQI